MPAPTPNVLIPYNGQYLSLDEFCRHIANALSEAKSGESGVLRPIGHQLRGQLISHLVKYFAGN